MNELGCTHSWYPWIDLQSTITRRTEQGTYKYVFSIYTMSRAWVSLKLRSECKVEIKNNSTSLTRVYNSQFYRGTRLRPWDTLPRDLQKEKKTDLFSREKSELLNLNTTDVTLETK